MVRKLLVRGVDEVTTDFLVLVGVPDAGVDEILMTLLVLTMSGSVRIRRLRGFQP